MVAVHKRLQYIKTWLLKNAENLLNRFVHFEARNEQLKIFSKKVNTKILASLALLMLKLMEVEESKLNDKI